jgi:hypothetical protein
MTEAYPLRWPDHKPRAKYRENSRFRVSSFAVARDELFRELGLLGAKSIVLSTNIPLRLDGIPYANFKTPADPGVSVYFQYKGKSMAFACDRWQRIEENIQAVQLTINALRGIARWGTGDMLQAAFDGFQALPPPSAKKSWWDVLEVSRDSSDDAIRSNYRRLCMDHHPDHGGAAGRMAEINAAWDEMKKDRGLS